MTPEGNVTTIIEPPRTLDGEYQRLPLAELHESPLNPRKYFAEGPLAELAESIRKSGVRTPLIARPRLEGGGYELAAGHRRLRAARIAGVEYAPVIVREMSDADFLEVLTFENAQREDVHPLEEASGYRTYIREALADVADVAAKVGKSQSYVYQRLKLLELTEDAQRALWDNRITAGHAILIARLEPADQKKALKYLEPPKWNPEKIPSVRELDGWLHFQLFLDLGVAGFDKEDPTLLSGAGVCSTCPKRAANIPDYAPPRDSGEVDDLCTDPRCYRQKTDNHLVRIKEKAAGTGDAGSVLEICEGYATKRKGALTNDRYEVVKPGDKDAQVAVVAEGREVGKVVHVRVKPERPKPSSGSQQSEAERRENEKREKERATKELAIRTRILDEIRPKISGISRGDLEALIAAVVDSRGDSNADLLCDWHGIKYKADYLAGEDLAAALPKLKDAELHRLAVEATVAGEFSEWEIDEEPKALLALAKRYKVDAAKIRHDMEESAKEAEGGTRKAVVAQLPALNAPANAPAAKKAPAKKAASKKSVPPVKKAAKKASAKKGGKK